MITPRGIRNNNPGNIRHGDNWDGMAAQQTDDQFIQFREAIMGLRALMKTLITYQTKHGLFSIDTMISRWAPPSENNTEAYIEDVVYNVGLDRDEYFSVLTNPTSLMLMAQAIVMHENGKNPYTGDDYFSAVTLALPGAVA